MRPPLVFALCLVAALAGAGGALFAVRGDNGAASQTVLVRQPLVRSSAPATIVVSKPVLARGFSPERIYARRQPGVVTVFSYFGGKGAGSAIEEGSGFVVDRKGTVLTAAHVIVSTGGGGSLALPSPARNVYVEFTDGDRVAARIVGWDPYDDVGVLHVSPSEHELVPVPLGNSSDLAVGQPVAAIGSPFGAEASLSVGVISGTGRTIPSLTTAYNLYDAIQTDAPINQGNSGGPLLDAKGRVIGINAQIRSSLASGFEGVSFAVPIDAAKRSLHQLLATGHVAYAYLGLETEDLTPGIARRFHLVAQRGAIVSAVHRGGPAATAGLRAGHRTVLFQNERLTLGGDTIVAIDGSAVRNSDDVARLVAERMVPGEAAWFTVIRAGKTIVVPVTFGSRP